MDSAMSAWLNREPLNSFERRHGVNGNGLGSLKERTLRRKQRRKAKLEENKTLVRFRFLHHSL